jgi:hypothetical protein
MLNSGSRLGSIVPLRFSHAQRHPAEISVEVSRGQQLMSISSPASDGRSPLLTAGAAEVICIGEVRIAVSRWTCLQGRHGCWHGDVMRYLSLIGLGSI